MLDFMHFSNFKFTLKFSDNIAHKLQEINEKNEIIILKELNYMHKNLNICQFVSLKSKIQIIHNIKF